MAKRFYEEVVVAAKDDGFAITLDGRELKTPGKKTLRVPTEKLADLIAAEWDAQEGDIKPETMPVTRLINVAIEITPDRRDDLLAEAVRYGGTDLTCYRASEPESLREAQDAAFEGVMDWLKSEYDIELKVTDGLLIDQDSAQTEKFGKIFAGFDDIGLTLALHLTAVYSSVVLAIAVMKGRLTADEALSRSRTDETHQIQRWGEDEEAAKAAENVRAETLALAKVLEAL